MKQAFELRAQRVATLKRTGRLRWIRETGTRARLLESVETRLLPLRERWDDIDAATAPELAEAFLTWAWDLPEVNEAVSEAYRGAPPMRSDFALVLEGWIDGQPMVELARRAGIELDTMLAVHAKVISYVLQVAVEQGVGLLNKLLEASNRELPQAVVDFPEHLRFGVPTPAAKVLAAGGVRHRRASVALGRSPELRTLSGDDRVEVFSVARHLLSDPQRWLPPMGRLVLENTLEDLRRPNADR